MSAQDCLLEPGDTLLERHLGSNGDETAAMLQAVGHASLDALVDAAVPPAIRLRRALDLPAPTGERETLLRLRAIAGKNRVCRSYLGTGYSDTVTPPVILRNIMENPAWYTSYTPYQAEISQGRLEACYPLNGQDLSTDRTPLEAGLGFFVSLSKAAEFPGKAVLSAQKAGGTPARLVAIKPLEKGAPPRSHYPLFAGTEPVGEVTSGTLSPTLGHGIAMAYVASVHAQPGTRLDMEVRGQRLPVEVVAKPFYKKS